MKFVLVQLSVHVQSFSLVMTDSAYESLHFPVKILLKREMFSALCSSDFVSGASGAESVLSLFSVAVIGLSRHLMISMRINN